MVVALAPATVLAGDYKLGISDKVKIKVQEWPDLAGEYTVNPDGVVSLPLIGSINVVGLNLNDLAREISDRLQRRSEGTDRAFAAVEIAQYRPFAILGDVQKPGQYPYRPGLTVLEAISVAGGYYRPELGTSPAWREQRHHYPITQAEPADCPRSATERGDRWTRGYSPAAGICEEERS